MMKNLLYKELKLAAHPTNLIFLAFGAMLLIPSYIYFVPFIYTGLTIFFVFLTEDQNNGNLFTAALPVAKADAVRARCLFVSLLELLNIAVAVPFAILSVRINPNPDGNIAGIEPNVAFFGFVFIALSAFNLAFLPLFYKSGYRAGRSLIVGLSFMMVVMCVCEALVYFPVIGEFLDTTETSVQLAQIPILIAGIVVFALTMWISCAISIKNFEKVDL